jgi:predicted transposase/invertase (TIGR01784 family)
MADPKYINPFTDFGFKKIFGEEANKDLLIDFLNELLRNQHQQISDLTYKKTDRLGISTLDRNVVFDLYCENKEGEKFTVELQKAKQVFFKDRMLYYSTFSIQEQGIKGEWDYQLKSVFVIAILDFVFDEKAKDDIVVTRCQISDIERHVPFYEKLTFITLQMPNFKKSEDQLETNFDKWLYVIKNLHQLDHVPEAVQNRIFEQVFKTATYSAMSAEDRDKYEQSLKYYNDLKNSLDTSFAEGEEKARIELMLLIEEERRLKEEAIAKESEERRQKEVAIAKESEERRQKEVAIAKELEERRQKEEAIVKTEDERRQKEQALQNLRTIAKLLLQKGDSIEDVAKITGLTVGEIEEL